MSIEFDENSRFFSPAYQEQLRNGKVFLIDPEAPHWIATDQRGARIMRFLNKKNFHEIVGNYCREERVDWTKGWLHCQTFIQDALRSRFISTVPFHRSPYPGRAEVLQLTQLTDLWLHVTNACNLSCEHCLVDSSPGGLPGEGPAFWTQIIDQGKALGVTRFFITGGEPFLRSDLFEIMDHILTPSDQTELIILTNAMLFRGENLKRLSAYDPSRLKLQVSLDGPTSDINNVIRGKGSFDAAVRGTKEVISLGFSPTLTTVVTRSNIGVLTDMVPLASSLGINNIHLLLGHHRGRGLDSEALGSPPPDALLEVFKNIKDATERAGMTFDNLESVRNKLMGRSGVKIDLSNTTYESLCVYADGQVYPSAALAGIPSLRMGNPLDLSLEAIWKSATIGDQIRKATVRKKRKCKDCYLKYLCGGGDLEHTYLYSGLFMGEDPFSEFHEKWILEILDDIAAGGARQKTPSGYDRPVLFAAMGEDAILDDEKIGATSQNGFEISLSRSACVLSVDLKHSRRVVSDFYGRAAESPQPQLCCPDIFPAEDAGHIPKEVMEIAYGCGSPIGLAGIEEGETMVDLGSGGGIDCFIAAKKVGEKGRVVGIDMTDQMLKKANEAKRNVAENLGYDVVDFKKGYLEEIPLPGQFADLVTSNCVINLSPDKKQVFIEIWRVLKDFGRIVISDTVAEKPLPVGMKANPRLWGECISGALTEEAYLAALERAGFYGLSIIKKSLWKEVEGYRFYSVVIRGFKFEKKAACRYVGQTAVYLGPMQAVVDEEGHLFPRDKPVEVCTDTADKLRNPPYRSSFAVTEGGAPTTREAVLEDEGTCGQGDCC